MFVQTIRGNVSDPDAVRLVVDRWMRELAPGATGWLGSTSGVTDAGELFVLVRFESEAAARANSDRPEQGQWWEQMTKLLDGEPTFRDSTAVVVEASGDLNSAGFVQVILGQSRDLERSRQLMADMLPARRAGRPDILGSVSAGYADGGFMSALYFTSEAAAREGERAEPPADVKAVMEEMMSLSAGPPEYLDLRKVWLDSPR